MSSEDQLLDIISGMVGCTYREISLAMVLAGCDNDIPTEIIRQTEEEIRLAYSRLSCDAEVWWDHASSLKFRCRDGVLVKFNDRRSPLDRVH